MKPSRSTNDISYRSQTCRANLARLGAGCYTEHHMNLREKLGIWIGLSMTIAIFGVSAGLYALQKAQIESAINEAQAAQLQNWAAVCQEALSSRNDLVLLNYIPVLKKTQGLLFAYLARPNGEIMVHTSSQWILRSLADWEAQKPGGMGTEVSRTLAHQGRNPYTAVIGFSEDYRRQSMASATEKMLWQVLKVSAVVFLLGIIFSAALASALVRPIRQLVKGSEEIGKGNFNVKIPAQTRDELSGLAESFNRMARQLARLDELKDEFISSVTHDLRGPLSSISMYAEYLAAEARGPLNPRQKELVEIIGESTARLTVFINTILDMAKIKAGKMQYHLQPISVRELVDPVIKLMKITALRKNVALAATLPASLPAVSADPPRVEMAISNLVFNALKFTPEGGRISVGAREEPSSVEIFVADTGRGIAPDKIHLLFRKFEQIESGQNEEKIGTGLGLAIVKQTVEAHGGRIWVESQPGKGSVFHFTLPKGLERA